MKKHKEIKIFTALTNNQSPVLFKVKRLVKRQVASELSNPAQDLAQTFLGASPCKEGDSPRK